ncbi:MAG: hypothetical protein ABIS09_09685, partial [Sphingomicrobium sp.]
GVRVKGTINSGYGGYAGQNGYQNGYQNSAYGDLNFRCNVDYRGVVSNVRIDRNTNTYGTYRRY